MADEEHVWNDVSAPVTGNVVQAGRVDNIHIHPPSAPAPERVVVGDIPRGPAAFQQRDALRDRLVAATTGVLVGARGTGKTQLAAAHARGAIEDGRRAVVWIDAGTDDSTRAGWLRLADRLDLRRDTQASTADAARTWLEEQTEPSLIVFDDTTDPAVIERWLPRHGRAQVVLTTTSHVFDDFGTPIEVGLFDEDESITFVRERTGFLRDDDGVRRLVAELERLPLALALASAVIRRQKISHDEYLERLHTRSMHHYLPRHPGDPYPRNLAEAIQLSMAAVEDIDTT